MYTEPKTIRVLKKVNIFIMPQVHFIEYKVTVIMPRWVYIASISCLPEYPDFPVLHLMVDILTSDWLNGKQI